MSGKESEANEQFAHAMAQLKHSILNNCALSMDVMQELCKRMATCAGREGRNGIGVEYICGTCGKEAVFERHEDPTADSTSICAKCLRRQAAEVWKNGTSPEDGPGGVKWTAIEEDWKKIELEKRRRKSNDANRSSKAKDKEPWYYLPR